MPLLVFEAQHIHLSQFQPPPWVGLDKGQLWQLDAFTAGNLGHIIACHQVKNTPHHLSPGEKTTLSLVTR